MANESGNAAVEPAALDSALETAGFAVAEKLEVSAKANRVYIQLEGGTENVDSLLEIVCGATTGGWIGERFSDRAFMSAEPRWTYEIVPFETEDPEVWFLETRVSMSLDDADELARLVSRVEQ